MTKLTMVFAILAVLFAVLWLGECRHTKKRKDMYDELYDEKMGLLSENFQLKSARHILIEERDIYRDLYFSQCDDDLVAQRKKTAVEDDALPYIYVEKILIK